MKKFVNFRKILLSKENETDIMPFGFSDFSAGESAAPHKSLRYRLFSGEVRNGREYNIYKREDTEKGDPFSSLFCDYLLCDRGACCPVGIK
jgi:hypothetical protein